MQGPAQSGYDGVKVFSSTMVKQRERMGEDLMVWLGAHPECVPVNTVVRQSSDSRFHCLTIVVFWRHAGAPG
jgi:hypothetical protein